MEDYGITYDHARYHPKEENLKKLAQSLKDAQEQKQHEIRCPICGAEADTIYTDKNGDALGCEWCVSCEDAFDWWDKHGEY